MSAHRLSRSDARRIAVRAQLLDDAQPDGLLDVVDRLTLLQSDSVTTIAPSADLVAWSRLGSAYEPTQLADAITARSLVDLRGMVRPADDLALYRAEMAAWPGGDDALPWQRDQHAWLTANEAFRRDVLACLDERGPLTSREIPDTCVRPWRSSGWNDNRNVAMMLELLVLRGEVAGTGRRQGRQRLWDLAARVYPDGPAVPVEEALRTRNEKRLRSLGIARASGPDCPVEPLDVGDAGEPAEIDGVRGTWRVDPAQLGRPFRGRAALLSPLDRLVYDRKRMNDIFEFDYQLEMYKPAAKRRWGYFALPILYGDRLVGKLDASADRKAGVLAVHAVHEDGEWTPTMTARVHREIDDLAHRLGVEPAF